MTIAVHIHVDDDPFGLSFRAFEQIALRQPNDHIIFIFDRKPSRQKPLPANCTPVVVGPAIRNNLTRHYWYQYKIAATLNRYQADVFFTSREICSLSVNIPQVMMVSKLHQAKSGMVGRYRKKYIYKSAAVICFLPHIFQKLPAEMKSKSTFVGFGVDDFNKEEKDESLIDHPYYLAKINAKHPDKNKTLFKAFSVFKKMQRSSYQLVLIHHGKDAAQLTQLSSYKYRADVRVFENPDARQESTLFRHAFAFMHNRSMNEGVIDMVASLHHGHPVCSMLPLQETDAVFGEALMGGLANEQQLATEMMRLYKDEPFYRTCSAAAAEFAAEYTWGYTTQKLYAVAESAVGQRL